MRNPLIIWNAYADRAPDRVWKLIACTIVLAVTGAAVTAGLNGWA